MALAPRVNSDVFALTALGLGVLVGGCAAWLAAHDAQEWRWHRGLGYRPIRKLVAFDLTVALVTYGVLTFAGGSGWHALAAAGLVSSRTSTGGAGSLLFTAVTAAGGGGLALVTARLPAGSHPPLLKRLSKVRGRYLKQIRSHAARQQTEEHVYRVLPSLKAFGEAPDLELQVQAWTAASALADTDANQLLTYIKAADDNSLLAFAAALCSHDGGREFLKNLVDKGAKHAIESRQTTTAAKTGSKASDIKVQAKRKGSARRKASNRKRIR